jgi:Amt family ammonium transporter
MNLVPGLSLRATEEEEALGMDDAQLGEFAYDYVELRREFSDIIMGEDETKSEAKTSGDLVEPLSELPIEKA